MNNQLASLVDDGAGIVLTDSRSSSLYDVEGRLSTPQTKRGLRGTGLRGQRRRFEIDCLGSSKQPQSLCAS
jgi:hypothetical protein